MACSNNSISVGGLAVTTEFAMAAVSVLGLVYYYDKYKEDKNKLEEMSDKYMEIGQDYERANRQLESKADAVYSYSDKIPDYKDTYDFSKTTRFDGVNAIAQSINRSSQSIPADNIGMRCANLKIHRKALIGSSMARAADGIIMRNEFSDSREELKIRSKLGIIDSSPPSLTGSMSALAKTTLDQLVGDNKATNGFLYMAGRSFATIYNRYTTPRDPLEGFGERFF